MAAITAAAALAAMVPGNVGAAIGKGGTGKSTIARAAVESWPRKLVFDPYAARNRSRWARGHRERKPWWPDARLVTVDELLRHPELLDRSPLRLVVTSARGEMDDTACGRDFSTLGKLLLATEDIDLICEEAGRYARSAAQLMNTLSTGSGHFGMRVLLISQSIARFTCDSRKAISVLAVGAQDSPEDLEAVASRCGKPFADRVALLRAPPAVRVPDAPLLWPTPGPQES